MYGYVSIDTRPNATQKSHVWNTKPGLETYDIQTMGTVKQYQ